MRLVNFMMLLMLIGNWVYAHDFDIGVNLTEHYDDFHTPVPCHIHIYEDGTRREWDVSDETRLPAPDPDPAPTVAIVEADDVKLPEPNKPKTARRRLVLVLTEISIQNGKITAIKACSNMPNFAVAGKLKRKSGRRFIEIPPPDNRIYGKPVWNKQSKMWDEMCKTFEVNIAVSQLLLLTDGGNADILDVKLSEGVWHRHYQRLNTPTAYPYFNVMDGRFRDAWKLTPLNDIAPSAPRLRQVKKLPLTWAYLKGL